MGGRGGKGGKNIMPVSAIPQAQQKQPTQFFGGVHEVGKQYTDTLSSKQLEVIKDYTMNYYETINGVLRGQLTPSAEVLRNMQEMKSVFDNAPPIPHDVTLKRGTGKPGEDVYGMIEMAQKGMNLRGFEFTEPGYSSTSTDEGFPGSTRMIIHAKKGQKGLSIMDKSYYKNSKIESEVLLPPGTKFRVKSYKYNPAKGVEVHVEIVD